MKKINKCVSTLLVFTLIIMNDCQANTHKDSLSIDVTDSISVVNFANSNDLCENLNFVRNNKDIFIDLEEDSYAYLILIHITKYTKKSISIPFFDHYGGKISNERKSSFLEDQLQIVISEFCNSSGKE